MFDNLKTKAEVKEAKDTLGGNYLLETDVYSMSVDMAYVDYSDKGAMALHLIFVDGANTLRSTLWMTSGKEKGCKNTYADRNGDEHYLPGFTLANDLALMTCNKEMSDVNAEEKTINVWNFELSKEVPTAKQVCTEMIGKQVQVGVFKQIVDKNQKNDDGNYVATGETREDNEIDKFFSFDKGLTVVEAKAGEPKGVFIDMWRTKNAGNTRNRAKGVNALGNNATVTSAAPEPTKPKTSLFA